MTSRREDPDEPRRLVVAIDDDRLHLRLLERVAHRLPGVQLLTTDRGVSGIAIVRDRIPDLVILDLELPDMPGEEVLRALRADPATAEVPVVVLTVVAGDDADPRLRGLHADAVLVKPLPLDALERLLVEGPAPS